MTLLSEIQDLSARYAKIKSDENEIKSGLATLQDRVRSMESSGDDLVDAYLREISIGDGSFVDQLLQFRKHVEGNTGSRILVDRHYLAVYRKDSNDFFQKDKAYNYHLIEIGTLGDKPISPIPHYSRVGMWLWMETTGSPGLVIPVLKLNMALHLEEDPPKFKTLKNADIYVGFDELLPHLQRSAMERYESSTAREACVCSSIEIIIGARVPTYIEQYRINLALPKF